MTQPDDAELKNALHWADMEHGTATGYSESLFNMGRVLARAYRAEVQAREKLMTELQGCAQDKDLCRHSIALIQSKLAKAEKERDELKATIKRITMPDANGPTYEGLKMEIEILWRENAALRARIKVLEEGR